MLLHDGQPSSLHVRVHLHLLHLGQLAIADLLVGQVVVARRLLPAPDRPEPLGLPRRCSRRRFAHLSFFDGRFLIFGSGLACLPPRKCTFDAVAGLEYENEATTGVDRDWRSRNSICLVTERPAASADSLSASSRSAGR